MTRWFCCRDALEEEDNLEAVLKKAFVDADRALHARLSNFNTHKDTGRTPVRPAEHTRRSFRSPVCSSPASFLTSGTTATVALLRDGVELVVASVGDSRAILCRKGRPTKLSKDHTPDREDERRRYTTPDNHSGSTRDLTVRSGAPPQKKKTRRHMKTRRHVWQEVGHLCSGQDSVVVKTKQLRVARTSTCSHFNSV